MVIDSPPFQVGQEVWGLLSRGPGSTSQRGYSMTDSQIHPFDKGRVEPSREAQSLSDDGESILGSQAHHVRHSQELAPLVAFLHLAIDQFFCHLPPEYFPPSASHVEPVSKMGRERIEVQIEPITGEKRNAARCQGGPQRMNHCMR